MSLPIFLKSERALVEAPILLVLYTNFFLPGISFGLSLTLDANAVRRNALVCLSVAQRYPNQV